MKRLLAALALALSFATFGAAAGPEDPIHSAACEQARAGLDQLMADPRAPRGAQLDEARRRVADACLGQATGTPQRSGAPEPPIVVPPAATATLPALAQPRVATTAPLPPPLAIPRPTNITACDPAGCWDSEGRRLNQNGPFLIGPRGLCNSQGGTVSCP